jgi:PAS domain S-box-containing protein
MPKALIVDDHEENLYLLRSLLGGHGYEVTTAEHGLAALAAAANAVPDIIISDILMPVMDGFTLCRRWREDERFRDVPFVIYTATYTDRRDEELALSLGADLFLVKPLEPDEFLRQIEGVLVRFQSSASRSQRPANADEHTYLQAYSQALVRKLEDKVTALEEANRALLIKERAIEAATSGVAIVDLSGRITYANRAMSAMFGRECDGVEGMTLRQCCGDGAGVIEEMLLARGVWQGGITTTGGGDGIRRSLEGVIDTVVGPDGAALCRVLSCRDVTERGRLLAEMQRSQRLSALSLFAGGVAHDFNNLLAGLFGNIELAKSALPEGSPALAPLEIAAMAFERARDLTRHLLTFAIGSPPQRRSLAVIDVLRECCLLALSGSSSRWELETSDGRDVWPVLGDSNQLSQVFTNILVNASQAMPGGGCIHLYVQNREILAGRSLDVEPGCYVNVTISDEGTGIPAEVLPHVFDPLFTTKSTGSGLGLATSYSIVRSHGGRISASSPPGGGATITVLLPATAERVAAVGATSNTVSEKATIQGRVLLMDDEPMVREMASKMLARGGYQVVTAVDGTEAMGLCRVAVEAGAPFDVALLDVTVPGGMGGHETLRQLREAYPDVVVVLSSGYGEAVAASGEYRPAAILPKPYRMHELLACLHAAVQGVHT